MNQLLYVILGLSGGIFSGMFGVGGAVVLVPALVFFFGLSQHQAQGTTLAALVPPIGLLAALRYYYSGNVKLSISGWLCLGFFFGGLIGATLVQSWPESLLKKIFGAVLMLISLNMIVGK